MVLAASRYGAPAYCLALCGLLALLLLAACDGGDPSKAPATTAQAPQQAGAPPGRAPRVVDVTLSFVAPRFQPDPIVLQVGEPVQFRVTSADTRHLFIIEALGIEVEVPQKSLQETVTTRVVMPQEPGTFRMLCRMHARLPMEGTVEVTPAGTGGR